MAGPPTIHFGDIFPTLIESLFYGMYFVLFWLCLHILWTRKQPGYKLHLVFMIVLFAFPTTDVLAIYTIGFDYDWTSPQTSEQLFIHTNTDKLSRISKTTFMLSNLLADSLILYRCYVIWNRSWRIMIVPLIVFSSTIVSGALEYSKEQALGVTSVYIFMATTFATNVVVISLTAGRIWWINRKAAGTLGEDIRQKYKSCVTIMLETGAIYPVGITIAAICVTRGGNIVLTYTAIAVLKQLVGIAPTLILVRAGLQANKAESTQKGDIEAQKKGYMGAEL